MDISFFKAGLAPIIGGMILTAGIVAGNGAKALKEILVADKPVEKPNLEELWRLFDIGLESSWKNIRDLGYWFDVSGSVNKPNSELSASRAGLESWYRSRVPDAWKPKIKFATFNGWDYLGSGPASKSDAVLDLPLSSRFLLLFL